MDKSQRLGQITRARTREDTAVAASIVAQTFAARPVGEWLVPDPEQRFRILAAVFDITFAHAMDAGVIDLLIEVDRHSCLGGGIGVAVWLDHSGPVVPPPDYEDRLLEATGSRYAQFGILDLLLEDHHPSGPHYCLASLAVEPGQQDRGSASRLLTHRHVDLDQRGVPAHVQAWNEDDVQLFSTHGYTAESSPFEICAGTWVTPMARTQDGVVGLGSQSVRSLQGPQWSTAGHHVDG